MVSVSTALGVGSGIDTQKLVSDLAAAQRAPREAAIRDRAERNSARISALAQIRSALDGFNTALTSVANSGALGPQPVSADPALIGLTRTPGAPAAPFARQVEVTRLASAQSLSSRRFASANEPVGLGTLTVEFGAVDAAAGAITGFTPDAARPPVTITIDPATDSLAGLRDALSAAGLTASIVDDGVGVRLQIKGASGAEQGFRITAAPTAGSPAGSALADFGFAPGQSNLTLSTQAQDARLLVDGLTVERPTNLVTDLVEGYALELKRAAPGTPVQLSAARETTQAADVAQSFVEAYNEVRSVIRDASRGRSADGEAGPLFGQSAVRLLADQLSRLTSTPLATGSGSVTLAEIGFRTARDGSLSVDTPALNAALARDPTVLEKLFAPSQAASAGGVTILSAIGQAKPGTYAVTAVQPARSGAYAGLAVPNAFDFPVEVDATNAQFTITLDGTAPLTLSLPVGSYTTGASLAAAFESAINSAPALVSASSSVRVGWDAGTFRFLSLVPGARSAVALTGLDPAIAARLGLDGGTATPGADAQGSIGGVPAVGRGTRLTASAASAAAGLSLDIGATAPSLFTVTVGEGLSGAVAAIRTALNGADGGLATAARRFAQETTRLQSEATDLDARTKSFSDGLTAQFAAMERAVSQYKSIGSFLTQQVDAWNAQNR